MWYSAGWFRLAAVLAVIAFGATNATAESIVTVAGTGKAANNGDDGPVDRINIGQTFGVEFGPDGALYICEVENHRVRRLDLQTRRVTTVAGNGQAGYSGDGERVQLATADPRGSGQGGSICGYPPTPDL